MDIGVLTALLLGPVVMVVIAVIGHAGATGRIPHNHLVGIRLPSTMASDEAWRVGHRAVVVPACSWAAGSLGADVLAVVLRVDGVPSRVVVLGLVVVVLVAISWVTVASTRSAAAVGARSDDQGSESVPRC